MDSQRDRPQISSLNEHIMCVLCGGYMVDATAIMTCLHTFCKTCIVQYLSGSHYCPICDEWIHHSNPCLKLRTDRTLQDLIYKLVPSMLSDEIRRRKEHVEQNLAHGDSGVGDLSVISSDSYDDGRLYTEDQDINVLLEFSPRGKPIRRRRERLSDVMSKDSATKTPMRYRRYLQCPAPFTVGLMNKFLRLKFNISTELTISLFHAGERLAEHYTLMDVAYIYTLRRPRPLRLYFSVFKTPFCTSPSITAVLQPPSPSMVRNYVISATATNVISPTIADLPHNSMTSFCSIQSDFKKAPFRFDLEPAMFDNHEKASTDRNNGATQRTSLRMPNGDVTETRKALGEKFFVRDIVSTSGSKANETSSAGKSSTASRHRISRFLMQPVEKRIKAEIEPLSDEEPVVPRKLSVTIDRCRLSSGFWSTVNNSQRSLTDDFSDDTTDRPHHRPEDFSPSRVSRGTRGLSGDLDELHRKTSLLRLSASMKPSLPVTISRDFVKELVFARGLEMLGRANSTRL